MIDVLNFAVQSDVSSRLFELEDPIAKAEGRAWHKLEELQPRIRIFTQMRYTLFMDSLQYVRRLISFFVYFIKIVEWNVSSDTCMCEMKPPYDWKEDE